MAQQRCNGTNKAGERCNGKALPGSAYCIAHDPAKIVTMADARRKGGAARSNAARARKQLNAATGRADVAARVLDAMAKVEAGEMAHGPANAIANLARAYVAVIGDTEIQERLEALERMLAELKAS